MRTQPIQEKIVTDGVSKSGFTFYHRTGGSMVDIDAIADQIKTIIKTGFIPGFGDMYGKGIYGTTDRKSSFDKQNVNAYGLGIIKYLVPTKGILILDYNIAGIIFGTGKGKSGYPAYSLANQLVEYGIFPATGIPEIFKVLSDDLEVTWGASNRKLSAERAKHVFVDGIMAGGDIYNQVKNGCSKVSPEILLAYSKAYQSAKALKGFDKRPGVVGIVFSGNHDGNVIVLYKYSHMKPIAWGISNPTDPNNPNSWIIPMTPVKGKTIAANLVSCFTDTVMERGLINKNSSLEYIHIQGLENDTAEAKLKDIAKFYPWLKSSLNVFKSADIYLSSNPKDPPVFYNGVWKRGHFSGYFGSGMEANQQARIYTDGAPTRPSNGMASFEMGTFEGGHFEGEFRGGVFASGIFQGVFLGGLWKQTPTTIWGSRAKFATKNASIEYEGVVYPLDCDPPTWIKKKQLQSQSSSVNGVFIDPTLKLGDNIKNSLPYIAGVVAEITDSGCNTVEEAFKLYQDKYKWLWSKRLKFSGTAPVFQLTAKDAIFVSGTINFGKMNFTKYEAGVKVLGGVIEGDNTFAGEMSAGVYQQGTFLGRWFGGIWNADKAIWDKTAEFVPGETIGSFKVMTKTTILLGGKSYDIIPEALLVWKDIPSLIKAVKDGEYVTLVRASKNSKTQGLNRVNQVSKEYKTVNFTYQQLLDIIDDDDDDDTNQYLQYLDSVQDCSLKGAIEKQSNLRCQAKADKFLEQEFYYHTLSEEEQEALYAEFKSTYERMTGAAFSKDAFERRAYDWTFYGDAPDEKNPSKQVGGIAVRKQRSNDMYKLVASFGAFKSVLRGFLEFNSKFGNKPTWGLVSTNIQKILTHGNHGYTSLPGLVLKAMEGILKKLTNGDVQSVSATGVIKVNTPSGVASKVFICNRAYLKWLLDCIENPALQGKLPIPQVALKPFVILLQKLI